MFLFLFFVDLLYINYNYRQNGILTNPYHLHKTNSSKSSLRSKFDFEKKLELAVNTFEANDLNNKSNNSTVDHCENNINININHINEKLPAKMSMRDRVQSATVSSNGSLDNTRCNSDNEEDEEDTAAATNTNSTNEKQKQNGAPEIRVIMINEEEAKAKSPDSIAIVYPKRISLLRYLNSGIEGYDLFKNFLTRSLAIENLLFLTDVQLFRARVSRFMLQIASKDDVANVDRMSGPYGSAGNIDSNGFNSASGSGSGMRPRSATHERIMKLEFEYLTENYNDDNNSGSRKKRKSSTSRFHKWRNSKSNDKNEKIGKSTNKQLCRQWCDIHEKYVGLGSLYEVKLKKVYLPVGFVVFVYVFNCLM